MQSVRFIYSFFATLFFCQSTIAKEMPLTAKNKIESRATTLSQPNVLKLSLDEAILLAVRENPNVQTTQLSYVLQKFNLWVQEWQFMPRYAFSAQAQSNRSTINGQPQDSTSALSISPGISLLTPIGTTINLNATNPVAGNYNPGLSLQIMQPLMRGFGKAVVEAQLNNARDTEIISRLQIENVLRSTITTVINAYLDYLSAEKTVNISEDALARAELSVKQTKLFIEAGHKAGNELVTVQADVASAQTQLINDKNNLLQARFALLTAIGIDPNTNVQFSNLNIGDLIKRYRLTDMNQTKYLTLKNDIQYQTDQITLHGATQRNLLVAEDSARWQLNLTATATTGNGSGGGPNAGLNSIYNGYNQTQGAQLQLTIPIDDQLIKQSVLSAKIALQQAEIALKQEKWSKETSAINAWNLVASAENALRYAEDAERLQEKTYNVSYQKYLHGLIDSLALQQAQLQLIQRQQGLLAAQIIYLKALVNMDQLIGNTLKTWQIKVRLS
jgi:outer membrane protein TolC